MKRKKNKSHMLAFILATFSLVTTITTLILTACFLVYSLTKEKAYNEKWKDYDDCGLA